MQLASFGLATCMPPLDHQCVKPSHGHLLDWDRRAPSRAHMYYVHLQVAVLAFLPSPIRPEQAYGTCHLLHTCGLLQLSRYLNVPVCCM